MPVNDVIRSLMRWLLDWHIRPVTKSTEHMATSGTIAIDYSRDQSNSILLSTHLVSFQSFGANRSDHSAHRMAIRLVYEYIERRKSRSFLVGSKLCSKCEIHELCSDDVYKFKNLLRCDTIRVMTPKWWLTLVESNCAWAWCLRPIRSPKVYVSYLRTYSMIYCVTYSPLQHPADVQSGYRQV